MSDYSLKKLTLGAPYLDLPHRLMQDDHYRGMLIPEGTWVSKKNFHSSTYDSKEVDQIAGHREHMGHVKE